MVLGGVRGQFHVVLVLGEGRAPRQHLPAHADLLDPLLLILVGAEDPVGEFGVGHLEDIEDNGVAARPAGDARQRHKAIHDVALGIAVHVVEQIVRGVGAHGALLLPAGDQAAVRRLPLGRQARQSKHSNQQQCLQVNNSWARIRRSATRTPFGQRTAQVAQSAQRTEVTSSGSSRKLSRPSRYWP